MIDFRDFLPRQTQKGSFGKATQYEVIGEVLGEVNDWIHAQKVNVINVETVLLPNMHEPGNRGSQDGHLATRDFVRWHQFVRVWFRP